MQEELEDARKKASLANNRDSSRNSLLLDKSKSSNVSNANMMLVS